MQRISMYFNRRVILLGLMITAMLGSMFPASAQSLDTQAFTDSITTGMQNFFDQVPTYMTIGFIVFGIIAALVVGFLFSQKILQKIIDGLKSV